MACDLYNACIVYYELVSKRGFTYYVQLAIPNLVSNSVVTTKTVFAFKSVEIGYFYLFFFFFKKKKKRKSFYFLLLLLFIRTIESCFIVSVCLIHLYNLVDVPSFSFLVQRAIELCATGSPYSHTVRVPCLKQAAHSLPGEYT